MPDVRSFCPSLWQSADHDAGGDYYYDGIEGRWSSLSLTTPRSSFVLGTFREKRLYDPGIAEVADLQRYIDYRNDGRYQTNPAIAAIQSVAVTSLTIETLDPGHYREFLESAASFLEHTGGRLVNLRELDAASFRAEFLT